MRASLWGCSLIVFASFLSLCFAQEALLEKYSQQEQESGDEAENILQELLAAPLDLNQATPAELRRLPFLSRYQIDAFLAHRKTVIYYSSLDEAIAALRVRGDTLALCRSAFRVSLPPGLRAEEDWQAHLRWRLGRPAETDARWPGPPYRNYQRLQIRRGEIRAGALLERDPGESDWDDHLAFYVQWQKQHTQSGWKIVLGNYQIEWGHGLAFWSSYRTSISADAHAAARLWGRGVRPFLSSSENSALHGGALLRHRHALHFLSFASVQKYDAHLRDGMYAVRYNTSGYHRSARKWWNEKTCGKKSGAAACKSATPGARWACCCTRRNIQTPGRQMILRSTILLSRESAMPSPASPAPGNAEIWPVASRSQPPTTAGRRGLWLLRESKNNGHGRWRCITSR
jgi:hypothetical protein